MLYRSLGTTGIEVSAISFGCGPVSTLMVGEDDDRQRAVVAKAIARGINWFDTAATYGNGQSERSLGRALAELGARDRVHLATKVRLTAEDLGDIPAAVRRSVEGSLQRLQTPRITLLQLHNSVTRQRGDEPTSITPADVLGRSGISAAFQQLCAAGLVSHLGLTGIGHPESLREVINSGAFEVIQTPYHLLNPSAGCAVGSEFSEVHYGNILADCGRRGMGVLAIRVFAGGALLGKPPSPHTFKTPFFPLALYERDRARAAQLQSALPASTRLAHAAIRFVLAHPQISSALIGFGAVAEIDEALAALEADGTDIDRDRLLSVLER